MVLAVRLGRGRLACQGLGRLEVGEVMGFRGDVFFVGTDSRQGLSELTSDLTGITGERRGAVGRGGRRR